MRSADLLTESQAFIIPYDADVPIKLAMKINFILPNIKMETAKLKPGIIFLLLLAIAFICYRNCFTIFIPGDNYTQLYYFNRDFFSGFNESIRGGSPPYLAWFPILFFLYKIFGVAPTPWVIIAVTLHALNAFVVYLISKKLFETFFQKIGLTAPLFSAILFLISPYQTEDVLWVAISLRWLLNTLALLSATYLLLVYLEKPSFKKIIALQIIFLFGLFTNEIALVFPFISIVIFFLYKNFSKTTTAQKKFILQIIIPQFFFIGIYFLLSELLSGHWIWHGPNESGIQYADISKTTLKYFTKFFLLFRYWGNENLYSTLKGISENKILPATLLLAMILFFIFLFWKSSKKRKTESYFLAAAFVCFFISLLPVLPLDSSFLTGVYPDRYGYFASFFFYLFLVSGIYFFLKRFSAIILSGYSVLCLFLLIKTISVWNATNDYCNSLLENYKPFLQHDRVYVLNAPAYYKGTAAFRSAFRAAVYYKQNSPVEKIRVVSSCYQNSSADSILSVSMNGEKLFVQGMKKNTPYFSTDGGWAKSYETNEFKVDFDPSDCAYTLTFKTEIPENSAFIYTANGIWKKVN